MPETVTLSEHGVRCSVGANTWSERVVRVNICARVNNSNVFLCTMHIYIYLYPCTHIMLHLPAVVPLRPPCVRALIYTCVCRNGFIAPVMHSSACFACLNRVPARFSRLALHLRTDTVGKRHVFWVFFFRLLTRRLCVSAAVN